MSSFVRILRWLWFPVTLVICAIVVAIVSNAVTERQIDALSDHRNQVGKHAENLHAALQKNIRTFDEELDTLLSSTDVSSELAQSLADDQTMFRWMSDHDAELIDKEIGLLVVEDDGTIRAWCGWLRGVEDSIASDLPPDCPCSAIVWTTVCAFLRRSRPIEFIRQPVGSVRHCWVVALAPLCNLFDDHYGLRPERPLFVRRLLPGWWTMLSPTTLVGLREYAAQSGLRGTPPEERREPSSESQSREAAETLLQTGGWRLRDQIRLSYEGTRGESVHPSLRTLLGVDNEPIGGTCFADAWNESYKEQVIWEGEQTRNTLLAILCLIAAVWLLRLLIPRREPDNVLLSAKPGENVNMPSVSSGSAPLVILPSESPPPGARHLFLRAAGAVCVLLCTRALLSAADFPGSLTTTYFPIRLRPREGFTPVPTRTVSDIVFSRGSVDDLLITALFMLMAVALVGYFVGLAVERRARGRRSLDAWSVLVLAALFALGFGSATAGIQWLVRLLLERSNLEFFNVEGGHSVSLAVLLASLTLFMFASAPAIVLGRIAWFATVCADRRHIMPVYGVAGSILVSLVMHTIGKSAPGQIESGLPLAALLLLAVPPVFVARGSPSPTGDDSGSPPRHAFPKARISPGMVSVCAACLVFPCLYFGEESQRSGILAENVVQLSGRLEKRLDDLLSGQLERIASGTGVRTALENVRPDRTRELACGAMEEWLGTTVFRDEILLDPAGLAGESIESYLAIRFSDGRLISEFSTGVPPIRLWWRSAQGDKTSENGATPEDEKPGKSRLFGSLEKEPEWRTWNVLCNYAGRELRVHAGAALVAAWSHGSGKGKREPVGQVILAVVSPYQPSRTPISIRPAWPWFVPRPGERRPNDYSIAEFINTASAGAATGETVTRTDNAQVFAGITIPAAAAKRLEAGEPSVRDVQQVAGTPYELHFGVRKVHDTPSGYIALARPLPDNWDAVACFLALVFIFVCAGAIILRLVAAAGAVLLLPRFRDVVKLKPFGIAKWGMAKKLVVAVAVSSFVPIFFLAMFTGRLMAERAASNRKDQILRNAEISRAIFRRLYTGDLPRGESSTPVAVAARDAVEETSAVVGEHVDIYEAGRITLSSREEVFEAGLASRFLSPTLYHSLILQNGQRAVDDAAAPAAAVALDDVRADEQKENRAVLGISAAPEKFLALGIQSKTIGVMLGVYVLLILGAWWIGGMAARNISQPLDRLVHATERISRGDLDFKIGEAGAGDVGRLVAAFDRMTTDLRLNRLELARAAREAAWREIARQVAHEVKNPLTPIKLSAQHVVRAFEDKAPEFGKILEDCARTIVTEVELLERIATSFSNIAKLPECRLGEFDVNEIVNEALSVFVSSFTEREISVEKRLDPALPRVKVDSDWTKRVLINLVKNALEAMPDRGKLVVSTWRSSEGVKVAVEDSGAGIPPDLLPRIFEPYFSTKEQGTGLGLSICKRILDDLGGEITIASEVGRGTRAEIWLPQRAV